MKLKKGDQVIITGGKDRGKQGKIERVIPKKDQVLLLGLNIFKKHVKKRDEKNPGGIIDFPRPLPVSRVAFLCSKCKKQSRIGYQVVKDEKHRICKKCQQIV